MVLSYDNVRWEVGKLVDFTIGATLSSFTKADICCSNSNWSECIQVDARMRGVRC